MSPRSPVRAGAVLAAATLVSVSPASFASPPIPPVATIPVPPMSALAPAPATTNGTAATPAPVPVPAPAAAPAPVPAPEAAPAAVLVATPTPGAPEAMPAQEPPAPAPHVVLVDELPFRATRLRARELGEHAHSARKHGRHGRPFHPAPGIVVDVIGAQGGTTAADLQRAARNLGYWPFRHCYEEGLRRDQGLSGKISLTLTIAPTGSVDRASVASTTLHDDSVALCVAREAQHLSLASGGAPTDAMMSVTLATGDEPVPVQHPAPHADALREALRASWPAVEQCYVGELAKHPDAGGRMELRFVVKSDGAITDVSEGDTRFGDIDVTRCVLGVYRTTRVPSLHHGSHETTFVYALHLEARPGQLQPDAPAAPTLGADPPRGRAQNISPTAK